MNIDRNPLYCKPTIEEMKLSGVYSIFSEDKNIIYIGSAVNFGNRLAGHKLDCKRGKGNRHLMSYVKENGWGNISFEILEVLQDKSLLKDRENYWINFYGFENIINISPDAKSLKGTKMPESHRKKSSERMKGNRHSVGYIHKKDKGIKCANWWESHPEQKALMIERNREAQKKVDRTKWKKGYIIEVSLNGEVIDILHGSVEVYNKYPIGKVMISDLSLGKREEFNGYSLKYVGKFFKSNDCLKETFFKTN